MKVRYTLAIGAVMALSLSACGGSSSSSSGDLTAPSSDASGTLKVWLMDGSAPESVVDAVNAQFKEQYPDVDVQVELQQWSGIQDKLTTSLNTDATPCVAEFGNSQVAKFADAGLLTELTSVADDLGAANWLEGMKPPGELDGERYSIPYYGGDRIVVYNKAHFAEAGVEVPKTMDELQATAAKLAEVKGAPSTGYSAFYFPGKYWYGALPFIWTNGGDIAEQSGEEWKGLLNTADSQKGLTFLNNLVQNYSAAPKDGDETKNYNAFMEGNVGMVIDSWWAPGAIVKEKPEMAADVGVFALPGNTADKTAPVFLGGSDLGVSEKCAEKGLAVDWIKTMTNVENETMLAKEGGVIPNQQAAFAGHEGDPYLEVADQAAEISQFTPVSPNWANVEAQNVLPDMLVKIFTNQATVEQATDQANTQVQDLLNGK
jgi:N,N'-diacetylchitobiose transport system substrate-binding protein